MLAPAPVTGLLEGLRHQLGATFRIDRELGGGGMSHVFLGEELALRRPVVLKVLSPDLSHMLSAERFEREIRVAARLQHPHIVPLLSSGRAGDILYYTMPHIEGESLRTRIDAQGELPVREALQLFREVADALVYAHGQGVVHRDIKPDNILLSHRHAMVTDFGVARAVSEAGGAETLTLTGMAVGTPAYMAPEQAAAAHADHRADLYALGLVAYEMLAGQPPFRGSTPQAVIAAHMTQAPPPLIQARPAVPLELAAVVHRCLEKRAADRYDDAAALVAALDRVDLQEAATRRPVSRRDWLVVAAGLGVAAAGFGGGYAVARPRSRSVPGYRRLTFRRGLIRTARFAPDHQTVLYGALWDGDVCRVYTVRPDSPESAALALPAAAPLAVSSAGELALALGTHARGIMTYGTLARVPLTGGAPREVYEHVKYADWSPDGRELALVRRVGDIERLEFPAGRALADPATPGGGFSFVRVSPDGDAVAAFELEDRRRLFGRVVVIDRRGVRRAQSDRFANVFGLAWRGPEVWFTAADTLPLFRNAIHAMRSTGGVRIVARVPGNTSLHDIAPDGRLLVARTDDRSGIAVRAPGEPEERDLSWLDSSNIAALSRDGRQMLFDEYGVGGGPNGSTYLRDTAGSAAVRLGEGNAHALSPSADRAIVRVGDASHMEVVPTGAGDSARLARSGLSLLGARWLPDGERVLLRARAAGGAERLYVTALGGSGEVRQVTPDALSVGRSGWAVSPDGRHVAVSGSDATEIFPVEGGAMERARGVPAGWQVVGWIEGGILVAESLEASSEVFRADPVTARRERWADIRPQDPTGIMNLDLGTLVTTPDGRGYGYSWHRAVSDLYIADGI